MAMPRVSLSFCVSGKPVEFCFKSSITFRFSLGLFYPIPVKTGAPAITPPTAKCNGMLEQELEWDP